MATPQRLVRLNGQASGRQDATPAHVRFRIRGAKRNGMLNLVVLLAAMSCSPSPVDPQGNVAGGGEIVTPTQEATWDGVLEVDLESFSSTDELRADRKVFATGNLNLDRIHLDKTVAYSEGGLTRSMRYDWTDQGTKSVSIGRGIRLPHEVRELWTEVIIRWSPNFTTCNPADPPCDHKTIFYQVAPDGNYRWAWHMGGGAGEVGPEASINMVSPRAEIHGGNDGRSTWGLVAVSRKYPSVQMVKANPYFDGQWHVLRLHAKHSSDSKTYDARMRLWIDGVLIYDTDEMQRVAGAPGFATLDNTRIRAILLGRNKDKGLDSGTESMWIGRVRAYKTDPGW